MHIKKQTNKTKQKSLGTSPYMKVFMFNFITFLNSKFTIAGESEIKLNEVKWEFHKTRRYSKVVNKIYMYHHHFYWGFHLLDSLNEKKVFGL